MARDLGSIALHARMRPQRDTSFSLMSVPFPCLKKETYLENTKLLHATLPPPPAYISMRRAIPSYM
jgi:hypothetical protein